MSKTVEPNSTTPLAYSKEVFDQLCLLCGMNEMTKGPGRTIQIRDEGVFTEMVSKTLDWTFSCDLTEPGSPDPLTAPALPFLFTANHLAAFMLDGWGYFMQEACGDWATGPEEAMLQRIPVRGGKVKEALCGAYDAYRDAEMVVGKLDKKIEAKTQQFEVQYQEKERHASVRENFRERGISEDEYRQRHTRYKASIAEPRTQMEESRRQSDQAFSSWRKAMVNQLLQPVIGKTRVVAKIPERKRKHYLHDLFMDEQSKCSGSNDLWGRLLALAKTGSSQLIGVTEKGLQYLDANGDPQEFSKKQLDAYMKGSNLTRQRPPKGQRKSA